MIVNNDGKVLLQERGDREGGVWGFPGGAVEVGETLAEAAVREVREETGLEVNLNSLLGVYSKGFDRYPNGDSAQAVTVFFVADVSSGELLADGVETRALAYFSEQSLPTLLNSQHERVARDFFAGVRGGWD
ncbi:NUDIX domain-containing protein [Promicromonospora sp. MS192]|uniref:NUDIX domain-containing protein n=1 Tax=Promicromonospora sp. MS192 TaxID=3412684 RepID=UPI003C2AE369